MTTVSTATGSTIPQLLVAVRQTCAARINTTSLIQVRLATSFIGGGAMTKITVYRYDDEMNSPVEAQGWFTLEDAEAMPEADPMTAARHAQAMRRGEPALGVKETLYHTSHGRWVLKTAWHIDECGRFVDDDESDVDPRSGGGPRYKFLSDADALDWLRRNRYEDRIQQYLPELPDERGPGRPEIGGRVQVRLGHLLPAVDSYAADHRCSRAEGVRLLVIAGLANDA
jgi:hypothetical protein